MIKLENNNTSNIKKNVKNIIQREDNTPRRPY